MDVAHIERLLTEYSFIPGRKKELLTKISELQDMKKAAEETLKGQALSGMPHSTETQDAVYKAIEKIMDEYQIHLDYYHQELAELNSKEKVMYEALKCLNSTEHNIVTLRYIKGYRWGTIWTHIHYQPSQGYKINNRALVKLCEALKTP